MLPTSPNPPTPLVAACCASLCAPTLSPREAAATAVLFRALAEAPRIRIVHLLATRADPVCVREFTNLLGLSQPTVSHHLRKLTEAGLVSREQDGKWAYYALHPDALPRIAALAGPERGGSSPVAASVDDRERVRSRYAAVATKVAHTTVGTSRRDADGNRDGAGGEAEQGRSGSGPPFYDDATRAAVPEAAVAASLGCGNPTAVAVLQEGETVLDLGSGGGMDVLLSARRVGPRGKVYGLDMTEEMLALARRNQADAGITNVEWLKGHIEAIPLPAETVDVVISNCVINLSSDKPTVLRETFRVLRRGGRIAVSDMIGEDRLSPKDRVERGRAVGCVVGVMNCCEYTAGLAETGFVDSSVTFTHEVAEGIHAAIVRAVKP
jgi:arsenite methyltransferase